MENGWYVNAQITFLSVVVFIFLFCFVIFNKPALWEWPWIKNWKKSYKQFAYKKQILAIHMVPAGKYFDEWNFVCNASTKILICKQNNPNEGKTI